ncbi:hypothetical protein [Burkholderia pseudomallei]|uniref:hypothetical protein n=1 Tax=Burkholderia pseudomallei TaxID=28450 RepID=UPI0005E542E0|nr:hypothetical protein [Burkholderia pseudomallei]MBF3379258.1 hypothetical protein [Burkholderia pseudomallei]MBF3406772.1 hypothetical protein [Burkholderia pseudomallei]MBF4089210.1 hypothetical protein [Burkholderia pseudomallei]ONA40480.1 hypothetical protein AQ878_14500 [Burkholderia pseudomallei]TOY79961.1 hypothetical protein DIJ62_20530 [Burkholderia pseudomallei]
MQLVRLNGTQRAALSGTEIDGRAFVEVDLFHTQPDGAETFMRVLLSHERAAALAEALLAARNDVEPARLERSNG